VLNGADGLSEIAAGLVSQGLTILDSVRKGMPGQPPSPADNGRVRGQVVPDTTAGSGGSTVAPRS
jgi:flotillin